MECVDGDLEAIHGLIVLTLGADATVKEDLVPPDGSLETTDLPCVYLTGWSGIWANGGRKGGRQT